MNLLIITSQLPYPLNSGGNQAQFHFIEYMRNNFNISILYNENRINSVYNQRKLQQLWPNVKFFPYNWKKGKDKYNIIVKKITKFIDKKIFKGKLQTKLLPFEEFCPSFYDFVLSTIKSQEINLVEIDFNTFLPLIQVLPPNVKKVFVQHEIQFVRNELTQCHQLPFEKFIYESLKSQEIANMNKYNAIITLTDIDKEKLINNHINVPIYSSPACVSSISINKEHLYTDKNLTFIGGMGHYPNYHGINWFLENVWSILQHKIPNITLSIIGKWEIQEQKRISSQYTGVNFLGFVQDLNEVLNNSIMIVPILIGSGMRMKIVEAANHSCPFVTTTVGVEGLDFKNQKECFIADKPEDFANSIIELLSDKQLQIEQAKAIKEKFEKKYSIQVLGRKRFFILNSIHNE